MSRLNPRASRVLEFELTYRQEARVEAGPSLDLAVEIGRVATDVRLNSIDVRAVIFSHVGRPLSH